MATSRTQLEILIKSVADTTGLRMTTAQAEKLNSKLQETARASEKASTAAKGVGTSAGEGAKKLGEFQKAGSDASTMLGGLERASRGGIDAIFGIANAFRGFIGLVRGAVVASGPIGILVTVLGLAAGAMFTLTRRSKEAQTSLDDMRRSISDLSKQSLDALNESLREAGRAADEARTKFNLLQRAAEEVDNARQAAELAAVRADPSLSEEEKVVREADIRSKYAGRSDERRAAALNADVEQAQRSVAAARNAGTRPAAEFANAASEVQRLTLLAQEKASLPDLERRRRQLMGSGAAGSIEQASQIQSRISDIEQRTAGVSEDKLTAAIEQLNATVEVDTKAREAIQAAERNLQEKVQARNIGQQTIEEVARLRTETTRTELGPATAAARQRDTASRAPAQRRAIPDAGNLIYMRQQERSAQRSEAEAEIKRLEDEAFRLPSFSPEAKKLTAQAESKRAALQEEDAKFEAENQKIVEESKRAQAALETASDDVGSAIKAFTDKIVSGAKAAAAQLASAPVSGSGGTITKGDGSVVEVEAGQRSARPGSGGSITKQDGSVVEVQSGGRSAPSSGGTITRRGETIAVSKGDSDAVAKAVREATSKRDAADAETLSAMRDMAKKAELTQRQIRNMRERSQP